LKVLASELPFERFGDRFVIAVEFQQSVGDGGKVREIIRGEDLALNNGDIDLDLVELTGMKRAVDQYQAGIPLLLSCHGTGAPMSRTVIHDPEDMPGLGVRGPRHDLVHQSIKGSNPVLGFAATENSSLMDIERGEVSPSPTALVLMLDPHRPTGLANPSRMLAAPGFDTSLLVCRDHELVVLEGLAVPTALMQIQNPARFKSKIGVAREDPGSMLPGTNGIFVQPAPNSAAANLSDQARPRDVLSQVGGAPPRERGIMSGGQFTGESFNLNDQFWGKISGAVPNGDVLPDRPDVSRRSVFATG